MLRKYDSQMLSETYIHIVLLHATVNHCHVPPHATHTVLVIYAHQKIDINMLFLQLTGNHFQVLDLTQLKFAFSQCPSKRSVSVLLHLLSAEHFHT